MVPTRSRNRTLPNLEAIEDRLLLSLASESSLGAILRVQPAFELIRPNTPVAPFGSPALTASFIDPSATIRGGRHAAVGQQTLIGPFAKIDARAGIVKIGSGSSVLDNATVRSSANSAVLIGDNVTIEFGATILGPSTIGAYGGASVPPVEIGPNALIDGATIEPGAIVSGLARVGPGVVVPAGIRVLPGKNVTNEAEATNPALGKVALLTPAEVTQSSALLVNNQALASGYANLYQGDSATGQSPGVPPAVAGVFNGSLATVIGANLEPGTKFEPGKYAPQFALNKKGLTQAILPTLPLRIVGNVYFQAKPIAVAHGAKFHDSIRADQAQPITFAGAPTLGADVSINAPLTTTGEGSNTVLNLGSSPVVNQGSQIFASPGQSFGESDQSYSNPGANDVALSQVLDAIDTAKQSSGFATPTTPPPPSSTSNLVVGRNFKAGFGAVILGGKPASTNKPAEKISFIIGDNVTIGDGAVVERSSIGHDAVIGAHSLISNSLLPPGIVIPPGTIVIGNVIVGHVEW